MDYFSAFFLFESICVHHTQPVSNNLTSSLQSGSIRSAGFSPLSFSASVLAPFDSRYLRETGKKTMLSERLDTKKKITNGSIIFQPVSVLDSLADKKP